MLVVCASWAQEELSELLPGVFSPFQCECDCSTHIKPNRTDCHFIQRFALPLDTKSIWNRTWKRLIVLKYLYWVHAWRFFISIWLKPFLRNLVYIQTILIVGWWTVTNTELVRVNGSAGDTRHMQNPIWSLRRVTITSVHLVRMDFCDISSS